MNRWFSKKTDYIIKELVKALLIVFLFCLANKWLLTTFNKYIVDEVIVIIYKEKLNVFETTLTILLIIYLLYLLIIQYSNTIYKLKSFTIFSVLFVMSVYLYYRYTDIYTYTRIFATDKNNGIAFLDIPFVLLFVAVVIFIVNKLTFNETKIKNDLILDLPLKLIEDDEYDRREVYEGLIEQISKIHFREHKSFCLGIANGWGEGKTSFLNFLKTELIKDDNTIVIEFNPWLSINSDNLTLDFFHTLNKELSKYIYTGSELRKYANNLTAINSVYNPFKYMPNNWIGDKSHGKSFDDINELIKETGKRIFVYIDDLDRLDNKEVFNLLRTIRNTANFGNVHFVVPFDKSYIMNAINENKIYKPEDYIKKIFDVEIVLPPIPKYKIQDIFYRLFSDFITNGIITTNKQLEGLLSQLNSVAYDDGYVTSKRVKYSILNTTLFDVLKNKRDVIRFYNAVVLILKVNYNWIYLPDLMVLELLKVIEKDIYKALFENDHYLKNGSKESERLHYILRTKKEDGDVLNFVEEAMASNKDGYNIEERIDNEQVRGLISELFKLPDKDDFMAKYGIAYQSNFANYFQYRENGITFNDIDDLLDE